MNLCNYVYIYLIIWCIYIYIGQEWNPPEAEMRFIHQPPKFGNISIARSTRHPKTRRKKVWFWLVVTGCHEFCIVPWILGCCHHPNWRTLIFFSLGFFPTAHQPGCEIGFVPRDVAPIFWWWKPWPQARSGPMVTISIYIPILENLIQSLSGWWFGTFFIFPLILGMSSSQLTNIFQRGGPTTNQLSYPVSTIVATCPKGRGASRSRTRPWRRAVYFSLV